MSYESKPGLNRHVTKYGHQPPTFMLAVELCEARIAELESLITAAQARLIIASLPADRFTKLWKPLGESQDYFAHVKLAWTERELRHIIDPLADHIRSEQATLDRIGNVMRSVPQKDS